MRSIYLITIKEQDERPYWAVRRLIEDAFIFISSSGNFAGPEIFEKKTIWLPDLLKTGLSECQCVEVFDSDSIPRNDENVINLAERLANRKPGEYIE